MYREEIYRCNTLYHIRKEYGERQDRYSGYHSVSVELVRLQISHIENNDAVYRQIHDPITITDMSISSTQKTMLDAVGFGLLNRL